MGKLLGGHSERCTTAQLLDDAIGAATGFVPKEGQSETEEEKIKTRPKGCGCDVPGGFDASAYLFLVPLAGLGAIAIRRRRADA